MTTGKRAMKKPFLPVGIQNFETIRTGNFVYVDKTRHLYEMASEKAAPGDHLATLWTCF